ncbi:MAG: ion transporter [Rhodospirillaceae bacterium]|nr:ion transporter [Rhodospirillaceae bacterium]
MSDTVSTLPPTLDRLRRLVEHPRTQAIIAGIILLNAVTLGLETSTAAMAAAGDLLHAIDRVILGVFVAELAAKLVVYRLGFFRSGWNIFDFIIVGISLVPAGGNLSVLRALRILRVLRLLSVVPQMRRVVQALLDAIPGMGSIMAVLVLVFYVSAVLATKLFGVEVHPEDPAGNMQEWFGTVGRSMYSLFQVMTLESWSMGIVRPTMEFYPWAWVFFVPFIVLTSFAVLNLFIAIIVNSMQAQHETDAADARRKIQESAHADSLVLARSIEALRGDLADLRRMMEGRGAPDGPPHGPPPEERQP